MTKFVITYYTGIGQNDNFLCSQLCKFNQNDISVTMMAVAKNKELLQI